MNNSPDKNLAGDTGQRKDERWKSVAEFIDDCGMTCDCCQHVMIDVTAVMDESEKQHCITGDPEGEGAACSWGITHDQEAHDTCRAAAVAELIAAAEDVPCHGHGFDPKRCRACRCRAAAAAVCAAGARKCP